MDLSTVQLKERLAEENYTNFYRSRNGKRLQEASRYLWSSIQNLILALGACEDRDFKTQEEITGFLNELLNSGEISKEDIGLINAIHINALRNTMDEIIFERYVEKAERLINKLKALIRGRVVAPKTSENNYDKPFDELNNNLK